MYNLVIVRCGENKDKIKRIFTGWRETEITNFGIKQSYLSGMLLRYHNFKFDLSYTSMLKRSIRFIRNILEITNSLETPIINNWKFNEKNYGCIQGLNKIKLCNIYGKEKFFIIRRSYRYIEKRVSFRSIKHQIFNKSYSRLNPIILPGAESLKNTFKRIISIWNESVIPAIKLGKSIIIVSHGNSLRALIKHINSISEIQIQGINIPSGKPLIYKFDKKIKPKKFFYL